MTDRPRIAVIADLRTVAMDVFAGVTATVLPHGYIAAVDFAGGMPVLLPCVEATVEAPEQALSGVSGLVLAGGGDIAPAAYHAAPHPATEPPIVIRDEVELAVGRAALARGVPILGVCRGFQILNLLYGGDLVQHLGDTIDGTVHHRGGGLFTRHPVHVAPSTLLADVLGAGPHSVPSFHHQGVGRIGDGLQVAAAAPDGTIEALEDPDLDFCLGVLWHPEETAASDGAPLFAALVAAASAFQREQADARPA